MARRIFVYLLVFLLVFVLTVPAFAVDEFGYPIQFYGVGFHSNDNILVDIVSTGGDIYGDEFRYLSDSTVYNPSNFYVILPCNVSYDYINVKVSFYSSGTFDSSIQPSAYFGISSAGRFQLSSASSCAIRRTGFGSSPVFGGYLVSVNYRITLPSNVSFTDSSCICLYPNKPSNGFIIKHTESGGNITGTLSALSGKTSTVSDTLTGSLNLEGIKLTEATSTGTVTPGNSTLSIAKNGVNLSGTSSAVYVNGRLRTDASSTYTLGSTSSTVSPWLQVPSQTISLKNSSSAITGSITNTSGSISTDSHYITGRSGSSGTLGGTNVIPSIDFSGDQQTFTGSVGSSNAYDRVLVLQAVGVSSDADLINVVNTGFAQVHSDLTSGFSTNHSDLTNLYGIEEGIYNRVGSINTKMQSIVEHQNAVTSAGSDVASTTSAENISNTSSNLSAGVSALDDSISTVADINSVIAPATNYISLIGMASGLMFNFGNGVLLWAVLALIVCAVVLFLLRRIGE